MLNGLCKQIEAFLDLVLERSWQVIAQNVDDFDEAEVKKLLGLKRWSLIKKLSGPQRFAETVNGLTFNVFGLSQTLNLGKEAQKIGQLVQMLGASPPLLNEFAQEYSFAKLLNVQMKNLGINSNQLKLDEESRASNALGSAGPSPLEAMQRQLAAAQQGGAPGAAGPQGASGGAPGGSPPSGTPQGQSQVPQSGSVRQGGMGPPGLASLAQPKYPPSRALAAIQQPGGGKK